MTDLENDPLVLNTTGGMWRIAAHHGVDVVVAFSSRHTPDAVSYLAYRHANGRWNRLAGCWGEEPPASTLAQITRSSPAWDQLLPLLDQLGVTSPPEVVWVPSAEAAKRLGVSVDVIRSLIRREVLDGRRSDDGRNWVVSSASIEEHRQRMAATS